MLIFKRLGFHAVAERTDDYSESGIYSELINVEMEKQLTTVFEINKTGPYPCL